MAAPTILPNGKRIPGLKLDHPRQIALMQAGATKVDITPKDLTGIVSVWAKPFDSVHDLIFARVLVLDNGVTSTAIVTTHLVEFGDTLGLRQRIERELAIPVDHILITTSHDHNAPRAGPITPGMSSQQGRPASPPAYTQFVDDRILKALRQAKTSLQPARVGLGAGKADINVNRNGYASKGGGAPDPIVAGPDNTLITGDLVGGIVNGLVDMIDQGLDPVKRTR